jgi:hypothetical protein
MKTSNSLFQKITSLRGTAMLGVICAGLLAGGAWAKQQGIVSERIQSRTTPLASVQLAPVAPPATAPLLMANHRTPHAQPCHRGEAVNHRTGMCYLPQAEGPIGTRR